VEDEPLRMTAELESAARISSGLRAIRLAVLRHCIRGCAMVDHKALLYSSPEGDTDSTVSNSLENPSTAQTFSRSGSPAQNLLRLHLFIPFDIYRGKYSKDGPQIKASRTEASPKS
jgi:hypothetical protein